MKKYKK